ncbi:hypothetical protein FOL80_04350 [Lactobacillus reuteri]|uniref:hypothetical protein n=1 Tax=Limosilactobacillus reuteri TaxID=1598 RepID=UPI00146BFA47|nr:hypothetical protein [Limosilactobacillus reuteri]NMV48459.1 hypothetical protein [Limosilactobacillus reuteri]NMV50207.1 hypothetical protein [Limosilactobacillus reuteri]NMV59682.1 hypothetical protein [Limosilactobacillus reuteri]NMV63242.1 hypothetical protein [Limosilactobacillus reuteri]NMV66851.1 hypothetical protein [Limosilactobacillus reuteri]
MGLISFYQTNIQQIYNRITDLYSEASPFFDVEVSPPDFNLMKLDNSVGKSNRTFYDWTIYCIKQLQSVMNTVVNDFNTNGIIDENIGDTPMLELWLPERLVVDEVYTMKLNNNFDDCNKLIDSLYSYTKEYENY